MIEMFYGVPGSSHKPKPVRSATAKEVSSSSKDHKVDEKRKKKSKKKKERRREEEEKRKKQRKKKKHRSHSNSRDLSGGDVAAGDSTDAEDIAAGEVIKVETPRKSRLLQKREKEG